MRAAIGSLVVHLSGLRANGVTVKFMHQGSVGAAASTSAASPRTTTSAVDVLPGWSEDGSLLSLKGGPLWKKPLLVHPTWLRDHCRCPACYDGATYNKLVDTRRLQDTDLRPRTTRVNDQRLHVTWSDGHESAYDLEWLRKNVLGELSSPSSEPRRTLWSNALSSLDIADVTVNHRDYVTCDKSVKKLLESVVRCGFAIVKNVPGNADGLLETAQRICRPRNTGFFDGPVHEFKYHMLHSKHDSLMNEHHRLHPHVDQAYLTEPAGLKLIVCSENAGTDLLLNLVDGFQVAERLKRTDPKAYDTLATVPVAYEYVDDVSHHLTHDVILKHDTVSRNLLQVRYNMHYRTALKTTMPSSSSSDMDTFYAALRRLTKLVRARDSQVRLQLATGTVLVLDNWRVLTSLSNVATDRPGSTGTGSRFYGCYLGRSDYMCRARRLDVVP